MISNFTSTSPPSAGISFNMLNLYNAIKDSTHFRKMEVSELLFVEYTCMREETKFGVWSNNNYFAFIQSGKKMWRTIYHDYEANQGDILFIKKGANLTHQFFDDEFCAIFVFIPDSFIKEFLAKNPLLLNTPSKHLPGQDAVLRIPQQPLLNSYYQSIQSYLALANPPNEKLLLLKFEELLLTLFAENKQVALTDYFISICQDRPYQLSRVMEENFAYNLTLHNYAQLCHMSLSAFKKWFRQHYNATPANWLKNKKLELASHYLVSSSLTIGQISFECGFEDTSHFIRVFKQKYQQTPLQYRVSYASTCAATT